MKIDPGGITLPRDGSLVDFLAVFEAPPLQQRGVDGTHWFTVALESRDPERSHKIDIFDISLWRGVHAGP